MLFVHGEVGHERAGLSVADGYRPGPDRPVRLPVGPAQRPIQRRRGRRAARAVGRRYRAGIARTALDFFNLRMILSENRFPFFGIMRYSTNVTVSKSAGRTISSSSQSS